MAAFSKAFHRLSLLLWISGVSAALAAPPPDGYFPPPDSAGGWRVAAPARNIENKLNAAFELIQGSTKNGGLLVLDHGRLVYERYFGKGHRDATPNFGSCGKSFTSIAVGILMAERPELFPDGLDQKIFTPKYFPPEAFPLSDPAMAEIKLGQLLAFSACIRGNNPSYVNGKPVSIDPAGPDGWAAMVDEIALGKRDDIDDGNRFSASSLWCEPGGGYSYATSSIHLASIMLRHVTGMELEEFLRQRVAEPLGWGRWGYGYKYATEIRHTPGGGGIALRATDMLRFGYLLLNEGRWQDRPIVPSEYVRHASRRSPYNPHYHYSLQFKVNTDGAVPEFPRDAYWKSGSGGHVLYMVPSLDLVVWKLGGRDGQYGVADTGMETPAHVRAETAERKGWKPTVSSEDATRQTLEMVIDALR